MNHQNLSLRAKDLAIQIVHYCRTLPRDSENYILSKQLIRSATSAAANYRAARCSRSKNEWISKICITIEEIDETNFWLDFLATINPEQKSHLNPLIIESKELTKIFMKMRITARANQNKK